MKLQKLFLQKLKILVFELYNYLFSYNRRLIICYKYKILNLCATIMAEPFVPCQKEKRKTFFV